MPGVNYKCRITVFTASELLRKNQKEVGAGAGGGEEVKLSLNWIRVNVKYLLLLHIKCNMCF